VGLFRRVLELDPEDVVANFGLGKIYLDLERYEEAVPCFRRAVAGQRDYSAAFSHLGACLVRLHRTEEARDVLTVGIAAAARRGDLVPKADMTRLLEDLEPGREESS
jgi:Flp pilus assembly protein TadD